MLVTAPKEMDGALGQLRTTLVLVDPISSARCLAREASSRGFTTVAIWQSAGTHDDEDFSFSFTHHSLAKTVDVLQSRVVDGALAILSGSDDGVPLAEALSAELGIPIFTPALSGTRRAAKHEQQRAVEAAGLRACRGAVGNHWTLEMEAVCGESLPVVVKLAEGTGSEGTKLCETAAAARTHVEWLLAHCIQDAEVLVQEYLKGDEYVVDTVSRDGVHKVCMLWRYDKRRANQSDFIYYGERPVASDSAEASVLIPYALSVLTALGVLSGPVHMEIMLTATTNDGDGGVGLLSPCLIEANLRCHGGSGLWAPLAERLYPGGHTQVTMAVDAALDPPQRFASLPPVPPSPLSGHGAFLCLVSHKAGTVIGLPGIEMIHRLPSFLAHNPMGFTRGSKAPITIDLFTLVGMVVLHHATDAAIVDADAATIRRLEADGKLFELAPPAPPPRRRTIGFGVAPANTAAPAAVS